MSDEFVATVELALIRGHMQAENDAFLGAGHTVTDDEAREAIAWIAAEREFEQMMRAFLAEVADRPAGNYRVVMSSKQRDFVRWLHQRHQRDGIYRGGRSPALFGAPIAIDDTAQRPRLEQM